MDTFRLTLHSELAKQIKNFARASNQTPEEYLVELLNGRVNGIMSKEEAILQHFLPEESREERGYNPRDYHFRTILAEKGSKRVATVRIPDWLSDAMLDIINLKETPYNNWSDFLADAIWHRIQQVRVYMLPGDWAGLIEDERKMLKLRQQQENNAIARQTIDSAINNVEIAKSKQGSIGVENVVRAMRETVHDLETIVDTTYAVRPSLRGEAEMELERYKKELADLRRTR